MLGTGLRNCLLNNFEPLNLRLDEGALWGNTYFRMLLNIHPQDELFYWRTSAGNEVDFVLSNIQAPYAVEVKYDQSAIKESKYKMFSSNYPDIPLRYAYLNPFTENFFVSLYQRQKHCKRVNLASGGRGIKHSTKPRLLVLNFFVFYLGKQRKVFFSFHSSIGTTFFYFHNA